MTTKTIDKEALLKGIEASLASTNLAQLLVTGDGYGLGFAEGAQCVLKSLSEGISGGRFDTKEELQVFTEEGLEDTNPDENVGGVVAISPYIDGKEREEMIQYYTKKGYTVI